VKKLETKIKTNLNRKGKLRNRILAVGLILLITMMSVSFVASSGVSTRLEKGSFVETASYVIWGDDGTYYAKNGATGQIDYQDENITVVWENVRDNGLTSGRAWKEKVVLKGFFELNNTIILPSYLILDLTQSKIKIADNFNDVLFYQYPVTSINIDIIGGTIDGNSANQASGGIPFLFRNAQNVTFDGIFIHDCFTQGITLYSSATGSYGCVIQNCRFLNIAKNAVEVLGLDTHDMVVRDNFFENCGTDSGSKSISISQATDVSVIGNSINGGIQGICLALTPSVTVIGNVISGTEYFGIHLLGNTVLNITGALVSGNIVHGCWGAVGTGIGADAVVFSSYTNNICYNNSKGGLGFENTASHCGYGNIISGNTAYYNGQMGIFMTNQIGGIVSNNIVYSNNQENLTVYDSGIMLVTSFNITVDGNYCTDNQTSTTQRYGIKEKYDTANPDYNYYFNNYVAGNNISGFSLLGAHNTFSNNIGFVTENLVSGVNSTATTFIIAHGLAGTATHVTCSFNSTAIEGYSWTSDGTNITVTVVGTLPAAMTCYADTRYEP